MSNAHRAVTRHAAATPGVGVQPAAVLNDSTLDDPAHYERLDPSGLRHRIASFADQCHEAWGLSRTWLASSSLASPQRVVVVGMGGSAIGANLAAEVCMRRSSLPVRVHRSAEPPQTDEHTLLIASSHSGDTEETLAAFQGAAEQPGARLAITRGGALQAYAERSGIPVLQFEHDGEPRSALGFGTFLLLGLLTSLDMLSLGDSEVCRAIAEMQGRGRSWWADVRTKDNAAKRLALRLHGGIPVVLGEEYLGVAARRWQSQFNENSKQWAFSGSLPEAAHNLLEGFGQPTQDLIRPVLLEGAAEHPRERARTRLIADSLLAAGHPCERLDVRGSSELATLLIACHLGDWVSLHLAMLNDVDPAPVPAIGALKRALRSEPA